MEHYTPCEPPEWTWPDAYEIDEDEGPDESTERRETQQPDSEASRAESKNCDRKRQRNEGVTARRDEHNPLPQTGQQPGP